MNRFSLLLLIFFLLFLSACTSNLKEGLTPGSLAPNFSLSDLQGKQHQLSDYRGKNLLINFWASWCMPCMEEAPYLELLYKQIENENFEILAIAVEDVKEDIQKFAEQYSINFPILLDTQGIVRDKYKVSAYPESFFVDSSGKIKMLYDTKTAVPEAKIVGPRKWNSPEFIEQLSR